MKSSVFVGSAAACICLCLVSLLDPVHALARDASDIPDSPPAQKLSETEAAAIFHEIQVFASVEISMRAAMAIVEKHTGAKVVDISFDGRVDRSAYRIKAYQDQDIWNGAIDASTGTMIGDGIVTAVSSLDVKDKVALAGFRTAGIDLSDAAEIAQNQTTGKAVSAGCLVGSGTDRKTYGGRENGQGNRMSARVFDTYHATIT
jgi:hypothetical protein